MDVVNVLISGDARVNTKKIKSHYLRLKFYTKI